MKDAAILKIQIDRRREVYGRIGTGIGLLTGGAGSVIAELLGKSLAAREERRVPKRMRWLFALLESFDT